MADRVTRHKSISGIVFVACILLGVGIGMAVGRVAVGSIIGVAVGFIAMALVRTRNL